jgi:hypothetical protein
MYSATAESRWHRFAALLGVSFAAVSLAPTLLAETDIAAVYAATANGYARVRLADHSYQPETYTFAEGGRMEGLVADRSIDETSFMQIARVMVPSLRQQNYIPSGDPKKIDLMITVFWGTTAGAEGGKYRNSQSTLTNALSRFHTFDPSSGYIERIAQHGSQADPYPIGDTEGMMRVSAQDEVAQMLMLNQAENAIRDRNNSRNAVILGFWEDYNKAMDLPTFAFSPGIIEELEADRYFVVLKAYDFQLLRTQKQKKLLWETRFSVRERRNQFDRILPVMAQTASQYFGQNSGRLLRKPVPVGRVDMGTPRVVEHTETR